MKCTETLFFDYRCQRQLEIRLAKFFNTYGPHIHPNEDRVVSNFIVQILQGNHLTICGDSSQKRSFCHLDDLIKGFIRFMNTPNGSFEKCLL